MSASIHVSERHPRRARHDRTHRLLRALAVATRFGLVFASLIAALAGGLATQIYDGPWAGFVARDLCGAFYALAWCFGLALLRPTASPRFVASIALALCVAIEGSQLWHPHALEVARATLPGRLALGSGFAFADLPWYAVGAGLGALWLALLPFRRPRSAQRDAGRRKGAPASGDFVRPMGVRP